MMGRQQRVQRKLFYTKLNLDQRIRKDHILRKVNTYIDFEFIYNEVKDRYGIKGKVINHVLAPDHTDNRRQFRRHLYVCGYNEIPVL